jgi:biopolymer transport protein ExbB
MTVVIERAIFWIKEARIRDTKLMHQVFHLVEHGLYEEAKARGEKSGDFLIRIFLSSIPHHHLSLEGALEMSALKEINRMKLYLAVLDTIITVSPLLGILGTVTGIFSSFNILGQSAVLSPDTVARGIAEAIITTIAGLGISIPTLIAYNYFCFRVEKAAIQIEEALTNFKIIYQKGRTRKNETVMAA